MNWITPTKKTFNGHNTSCFKDDLIAVNGFNEDMKYYNENYTVDAVALKIDNVLLKKIIE